VQEEMQLLERLHQNPEEESAKQLFSNKGSEKINELMEGEASRLTEEGELMEAYDTGNFRFG
jgi:hypothetical protein